MTNKEAQRQKLSMAKLEDRIATLEDLKAAHARANRRLAAEAEKHRQRADALAWALVLAQQHAKRLAAEVGGDGVALAV